MKRSVVDPILLELQPKSRQANEQDVEYAKQIVVMILASGQQISLKYQAFVVVGVLGSTNMVYIPIGTEITASNTNIHLKGGKLECEKFCKILSCKGPETRLAAIPETAKYDDLLDNSFALYQDPTKYSNPGKYPPSRKPTRKRIPYMA
ncbi:hypothetical protein OGAPHI_000178 [Ogataea philodendri]|uniref:Uncharacterized protein n=1 Tax=Ogataea philodendri TaxID=1378263 RepID=A0A9P8TA35_9ASCO|nr:uncharacterized protein OGAPHI_000178 [Ogataea philodendri]KAH3671476.1 hypothetical protein OGAPHI_000178 [Ogataea philodendri]